MIFDKFCRVVERAYPDLIPLVNSARLFVFDGKAHEFLPKDFTTGEVDFYKESFVLPFPIVAVEDKAGCVFLIDSGKDAIGINSPRSFIDVLSFGVDLDAFGDRSPKNPKILNDPLINLSYEPLAICFGTLFSTEITTTGYQCELNISRVILAYAKHPKNDKDKIVLHDSSNIDSDMAQNLRRSELQNAMTAMEEMMYLNIPQRFILEDTPIHTRKEVKGRIPRSDERSIYSLLTPRQIRTRFGIRDQSDSEWGTKQGHERRRHTRTFKNPRYREMLGKTIIIPATWVGPDEHVTKTRRYKVRLDL